MKRAGQIVLFKFPQADLVQGKLRPALLVGKLPGQFDDWLICMISSQTQHYIPAFDELVQVGDADFTKSGLKNESLVRVGRLAVVNGETLLGAIGEIDEDRMQRIKMRLAKWLTDSNDK